MPERPASELAGHPRMVAWWRDDHAEPDRLPVEHPDVQRLAAEIAPEARAGDLGGAMSLNARLEPAGLVLRVHQPFVSRARLLAVQEVRRRLADAGLVIPTPLTWRGASLFRCRDRWAELEAYIPHERLPHTIESYAWLFRTMGTLHRALAALDVAVPRPVVATYAPPGSLRRWLPVTEAAIRGDVETTDTGRLLRDLVGHLRRQWIPASELPVQLVHGDVRLSNIVRTEDDTAAYLDFGFLAARPRIHELAYALAFMLLALDVPQTPERFAWHTIPRLVAEYEATARTRLTAHERRALAPYTAAVPLYFGALAGFSQNPAGPLRARLSFLRLSAWLLDRPDAMRG